MLIVLSKRLDSCDLIGSLDHNTLNTFSEICQVLFLNLSTNVKHFCRSVEYKGDKNTNFNYNYLCTLPKYPFQ